MNREFHVEFLTATILRWQKLLDDDYLKVIVVNCLEWLVVQKKCKVFGFVIMPNHVHLLWRIEEGFTRTEVQTAFFSFTGHQFQKYLRGIGDGVIYRHYVKAVDRKYQFWERDHMVKECWSSGFMNQKLDYIHNNPCQPHWNLVDVPESYQWSSASFYLQSDQRFSWLTHLAE